MGRRHLTIETAKGLIVAALFERDCPATDENFARLVQERFYDGTAVHALEPEGLPCAGHPLSRELSLDDARLGTGRPVWTIPCEWVGNRNRHEEGALTMLTEGLDTGGSRFGMAVHRRGSRSGTGDIRSSARSSKGSRWRARSPSATG